MKSEIISKLRNARSAVSHFFSRIFTTSQPLPFRSHSQKGIIRLRIYAAAIWIIFPLLCFLFSEYICFINPRDGFLSSAALGHIAYMFSEKLSVVIFDLAVLYIVSFTVSLLFGRLWVSCAMLGITLFCLSSASFFKYQVTGEYFYPLDIRQAGNTELLVDYINTDIPPTLVIIAVLILSAIAFLVYTRLNVPVKAYIRIPAAIAVAAAIILPCCTSNGAERLVSCSSMSFDELANGTECNESNGFLGAMMLEILSEAQKTPEEYSEKTIDDIISHYAYTPASESFSKPNVIVILQESFWDIRDLPGCTYSEDILKNYDDITARDNVYSGKMLSPTFGGGTVQPEFELLTGLTSSYLPSGSVPYQFIDDSFDSYPTYLKKLGYATVAVHPYLSSFYERQEKYPLLGFDKTYFYDDLKETESLELETRGQFVSDDSFAECIEYFLEQSTEPLFLFGISMEGHQPYENKYSEDELNVSANCSALDDELENILTQYAQCVIDADAEIGRLAEYIDSFEEDTILIVFGDHAPSLGNDKAVYRATGYISEEGLTNDDMERLLETPFFIMTNFDTCESTMLSNDSSNIISPYNILNAALELAGAPETPLMAFLKDYAAVCSAYNPKIEAVGGTVAEYYIKAHEFLSYDRIRGNGYSAYH